MYIPNICYKQSHLSLRLLPELSNSPRALGTQHCAHLSSELKMMSSSKSLLLAALMSLLLLHLCSQSEGKCLSSCSHGRKDQFHFPLSLELIWGSPKEGSLLECLQKGLMGVVSSLVNEGGKGSCCLSGFFLCAANPSTFCGVGSLRETPELQRSAKVLFLGVM